MRLTTKLAAGVIGGGIRIPYIMRDEFLTDRSAGAINGTAAEPGPGTRTVTDTENKLTISGGKLVCAGGKATPASGDPGFWLPVVSRSARPTLISKIRASSASGSFNFGFDSNQAGPVGVDAFGLSNASKFTYVCNNVTVSDVGAYSADTDYTAALVLRSDGSLFLVKGGAFTSWTLLFVGYGSTTASLYPGISNYDKAFSFDAIRLATLPAPFNDDYGLATQRLAGARTAGDTFTHEANCLIEWVVTTRVDGQQVVFRQQDSDNRWRVDVAADGSIALQEIVAGTPVSRGTGAAGSIANGQQIKVVADGSTIRVYANGTLKITYASATNFATATAGSVAALGTGGAISDVVTWPRTITGRAAAILNKASA